MKFCERLKLARSYAKLTQQQLVDRLGTKEDGTPLMAQANLAKMELSQAAKGSIYSANIAEVCGVSATWLSNEIGEMLAPKPYDMSERLQVMYKLAQPLPDYAIDEIIRDIVKTGELIARAKAEKPNGTEK